MTQRTDEWHQSRVGRITASRFKDVLAVSKRDGSPLQARREYLAQLVAERLTGQPCEKIVKTAAMQHGIDMESFAQTYYMDSRPGDWTFPDFVTHPELPYVGCSPDLLGTDRGVEIKCPFNESVHLDTLLHGMPDSHVEQVQGGMWVNDLFGWDFVSYHPSFPPPMTLYVQTIPRDESFIRHLDRQVRIFHFEVQEALHTIAAKFGVKLEGEWA